MAEIDLTSLPNPQSIETLSYEAIFARKKARFLELWDAVRVIHPELPDYDVEMLETDPVTIILQEDAYDELLLRDRANAVLKSNLLAFSTGTDLDHLAADHNVTRLPGESDESLRQRIVLHDQGSSSAGPEEWYKFHARSVSADVRDVAVYRPGTGPEISIAVLSVSNGGVPTQALLDAVAAVVTSSSVRSINDVVTVVPAVTSGTTVDVVADVWLLPDTLVDVFNGLEAKLRTALTLEGGIGFDINRNWIAARLMATGVSNVVVITPAADRVVAGNEAATFGTITLNLRGRTR
jgi:phage-related baseplate assembly protein